jgi:hypothetical protein
MSSAVCGAYNDLRQARPQPEEAGGPKYDKSHCQPHFSAVKMRKDNS